MNFRPDRERYVPGSWTADLSSECWGLAKEYRRGRVLTSWTIANITLIVDTVLSELVGWPLLVTPTATEVKPTSTFPRLNDASGSGPGRD